MISYKLDEELKYVEYYAKKFDDQAIIQILKSGVVENSKEALCLSEFFWNMVDSSIEDEESNIELPWSESAQFWNEQIMNSFSSYLKNAGYESEWDEIVDKE